jgi:hypothetical protein
MWSRVGGPGRAEGELGLAGFRLAVLSLGRRSYCILFFDSLLLDVPKLNDAFGVPGGVDEMEIRAILEWLEYPCGSNVSVPAGFPELLFVEFYAFLLSVRRGADGTPVSGSEKFVERREFPVRVRKGAESGFILA